MSSKSGLEDEETKQVSRQDFGQEAFAKGDQVEMRDKAGESWNDGVVTSTNPLKVKYLDDTEVSYGYSWNQVRRPQASNQTAPTADFSQSNLDGIQAYAVLGVPAPAVEGSWIFSWRDDGLRKMVLTDSHGSKVLEGYVDDGDAWQNPSTWTLGPWTFGSFGIENFLQASVDKEGFCQEASEEAEGSEDDCDEQGAFKLAESVHMRDQGMEWSRGIVTWIDPLRVDGRRWDEVVRKLPEAAKDSDAPSLRAYHAPFPSWAEQKTQEAIVRNTLERLLVEERGCDISINYKDAEDVMECLQPVYNKEELKKKLTQLLHAGLNYSEKVGDAPERIANKLYGWMHVADSQETRTLGETEMPKSKRQKKESLAEIRELRAKRFDDRFLKSETAKTKSSPESVTPSTEVVTLSEGHAIGSEPEYQPPPIIGSTRARAPPAKAATSFRTAMTPAEVRAMRLDRFSTQKAQGSEPPSKVAKVFKGNSTGTQEHEFQSPDRSLVKSAETLCFGGGNGDDQPPDDDEELNESDVISYLAHLSPVKLQEFLATVALIQEAENDPW